MKLSEGGFSIRVFGSYLTICSAVPSCWPHIASAIVHISGSTNPILRCEKFSSAMNFRGFLSISSTRGNKSLADLAIGPAVSKNVDIPRIPSMSTSPTVGFSAYSPARDVGVTIDPMVSVPIDNGAKPAATPTAEPVDDPPGD